MILTERSFIPQFLYADAKITEILKSQAADEIVDKQLNLMMSRPEGINKV